MLYATYHQYRMFPKIGVGPTPKWMVKVMVPNPMNKWMIWGYLFFWKHPYTPYIVGNYWLYPLLKGSNRGFKQLGPPSQGTTSFPMIGVVVDGGAGYHGRVAAPESCSFLVLPSN